METERIALSQRERGRLRVLHEVEQGHVAQIEAARRMKLTDRHMLSLAKTLGVLSFTPLTMLQACAQAVDFKVGHHFGEGQPYTDS